MTTTPPEAPGGSPAGMPAHLWELAKSDVALSVPERVRDAVANGANAPEGVRRIAARIAVTGAALGAPAALLAVGGFADATTDTPIDPADHQTPLDGGHDGAYGGDHGGGYGGGLDPAPSVPGSGSHGSSGHAGDGGPGDGGGFASTHTSGTGDVSSGLGTTWRVQEGGGGAEAGGDWLTVQMFQDVTVTETADGMFVVDAYQYIVIRDDDGHEYVFKEHYQVVVPDPPGAETDLVIHERGHVHVIENPDGSFGVATADYGIEVLVGSDGDGRDEVGITQTQRVQVTDKEGSGDDDVTVDLTETSTSTSEDTGDEATTTIDQDQVLTDRDLPPSPFDHGATTTDGRGPFVPAGRGSGTGTDETDGAGPGRPGSAGDGGKDPGPSDPGGAGPDPSSPFGEEPADRGPGAPGSVPAAGTSGAGTPGAGAPGGSVGASGPVVVARPADTGPLASSLGTPTAAVAWHVETPEADTPLVGGPSGEEPAGTGSPSGIGTGTEHGTGADHGTGTEHRIDTGSGAGPGTDGAGVPFPGGTAPVTPSPFDPAPFDRAPNGTPVEPGSDGTGTAGPPASGTGPDGAGTDGPGSDMPSGTGGTGSPDGVGGSDGHGGSDGGPGGPGDPGGPAGSGDPAGLHDTGSGASDPGHESTDGPQPDQHLDDSGADHALVS